MKIRAIKLIHSNQQILSIILYAFLLCALIVYIVPSYVIVNNVCDFHALNSYIYILQFLPFFLKFFLVITLTISIVSCFIPTLSRKILLFAISYIIICGLFIPIRASTLLDGRASELHPDISFLTVIVVTISIIVCLKWFEKNLKFVIFASILFICSIIIYKTVQHIIYNPMLKNQSKDLEQFVIASKDKPNIFLISFDALQNDIIDDIFTRKKNLKNSFEGFIFFPNATSVYPFTDLSILSIKMGHISENNISK